MTRTFYFLANFAGDIGYFLILWILIPWQYALISSGALIGIRYSLHLVIWLRNRNKEDFGIPESLKRKISDALESGVGKIQIERQRQLLKKNYTLTNDERYTNNELERAAACYIRHSITPWDETPLTWPFDKEYWRPSEDPNRNLEKAGALCAAAIDRNNFVKKVQSFTEEEIAKEINSVIDSKWENVKADLEGAGDIKRVRQIFDLQIPKNMETLREQAINNLAFRAGEKTK